MSSNDKVRGALEKADAVFKVAFDGSPGSLTPNYNEQEAARAVREALAALGEEPAPQGLGEGDRENLTLAATRIDKIAAELCLLDSVSGGEIAALKQAVSRGTVNKWARQWEERLTFAASCVRSIAGLPAQEKP